MGNSLTKKKIQKKIPLYNSGNLAIINVGKVKFMHSNSSKNTERKINKNNYNNIHVYTDKMPKHKNHKI